MDNHWPDMAWHNIPYHSSTFQTTPDYSIAFVSFHFIPIYCVSCHVISFAIMHSFIYSATHSLAQSFRCLISLIRSLARSFVLIIQPSMCCLSSQLAPLQNYSISSHSMHPSMHGFSLSAPPKIVAIDSWSQLGFGTDACGRCRDGGLWLLRLLTSWQAFAQTTSMQIWAAKPVFQMLLTGCLV